jgi:serpin B
MSRLRTLPALAIVIALLVSGCGGGSTGKHSDPLPAGPRVNLRDVRLTAGQLERLAAADATFGTDLLRAVAAQDDSNVVLSPASVAVALQMAYAGARGRTAAEMATVLHVNGLSPTDVAAAAADFLTDLAPLATDKRQLVDIANEIWVQTGFPLTSSYQSAMQSGFGADLRRVDFNGHADAVRQQINAAIAARTHNLIRNLLPPGMLDDTIRLVLTNAVYLHAQWQQPFTSEATQPAPFHLADGDTTEPMTMSQTSTLGYAKAPGYQAVQLPYAGGRLAMTILLPDGPVAPLEQTLAAKGLPALLAGTKPTRLTLDLPKFTFTWSHDLKPVLQSLGMRSAFSDQADFSGISTAAPLQIAFVQHKAFVAVDEQGTKAAAATAVGARLSGIRLVKTDGLVVKVDHPFLFAITDRTTGLPLFLGQVARP